MKIQKNAKNRMVFHNMQSHLTFYNIYIHIKYTIYECLVKTKHFRQEYLSILGKICKKRNKIMRHSIACDHIWHFDTLVLAIYTICESLGEIQYFRPECSSIMYENTQKMQ